MGDECAKSSLIGLLEGAPKQPGGVVESGVFRGASLMRIAKSVKDIAPERTVFGLDSFEGFPSGDINEEDTRLFRSEARPMGKFTNADNVPGSLTKFAETFGIKLDLQRGFFEKTLPDITERPLAFLHIGCGTYSGQVEELDALF